jgi:hypothetical protein
MAMPFVRFKWREIMRLNGKKMISLPSMIALAVCGTMAQSAESGTSNMKCYKNDQETISKGDGVVCSDGKTIADSGFINKQLEVFEKSEFNSFFYLSKINSMPAPPPAPNGSIANYYKQPKSQFQGFVTALGVTSPDGLVKSVAIALDRRFIDDPKISIFSRDLAKSLILSALSPDSAKQVAGLVNEIFPAQGRASDQQPSEGYAVFLGRDKYFVKRFGPEALYLVNVQNGEQKTLMVTVSIDGPAAGQRAK